jgi:ribosomal protein S18 acetylase RimI-like enzyme
MPLSLLDPLEESALPESPLKRTVSIQSDCSTCASSDEGPLGPLQSLPETERAPLELQMAQALLASAYASAGRPSAEEIKQAKLFTNVFECSERRNDPTFKRLLKQVSAMSLGHFHEDALQKVGKKSGWNLMLYCSGDMQEVWGFAVYKLNLPLRVLSLGKIAVPDRLQGLGFGKCMLKELVQLARKTPVDAICCSSLPGAIKFYERLGFKGSPEVGRSDPDGIFIPGQLFMEQRWRKDRSGKAPKAPNGPKGKKGKAKAR